MRFDEATQIARGVITEKYYEANPRDNFWSFWRANDSLHAGEFFSGAAPSQKSVTFASEEMGFSKMDLDETKVDCLTM